MTLAYLSGATGNPAKLAVRVAQQTTLGIPASANFRDYRAFGAPFRIDKRTVDRLALSTTAAPGTPLAGKAIIGTRTHNLGDVDPADRGLLQLLGNLFIKYAVTNNSTWQEWIFGLDGSSTASTYLSFLFDSDVIPRPTLYDVQVAAVEISAEPESNLQVAFDLLIGSYHFFGEPTQTAGSGSTVPTVTGTYPGIWDTADRDLYLKVVTIDSLGEDATLDAKLSAAAAYGGNNQPYTLGDSALRLLDESADRIGAIREQVRAYVAAGGTLAANDEFKYPQRRAAWVQSLGTERPIAAVNSRLYVNDVETRVEGGWSVRLEYATSEVRQDVSGEQNGTPSRRGTLNATVTLSREIAELTLQKNLDRRTAVPIVIDAFTDAEISTSGREYRCAIILPSCTPQGELFGVDDGGENRDEEVTLRAGLPSASYTYDGNSYASHCHFLIENDVTAL